MPPQYRERGQQNLWAVGLEQIANILTNREMRKQEELFAQEQARKEEQARADKERAFGLQERQIKSIEDQRADAMAARAATSAAATRAAEEADMLAVEFANETDPRKKALLGARIANRGGSVPTVPVPVTEKPGTLAAYLFGKYGPTPTAAQQLQGKREFEAAGRAPEKPDAPKVLDDPRLPNGVKEWLATFPAGRGITAQEWAQQKQAHPNADIAKAAEFLKAQREAGGETITAPPPEMTAPVVARPSTGAIPQAPGQAPGQMSSVLPGSGQLPVSGNTGGRGNTPPATPRQVAEGPDGSYEFPDGSVWLKQGGQAVKIK